MNIRSFFKNLRVDIELATSAVTLLIFFVFSEFFRFDEYSVFSSVVSIILGICFCAVYCLSARFAMNLFDNRLRTVVFVLLFCDFSVYGYFFAKPDVMRCISILLFAVSVILLFADKFSYIAVIAVFFGVIYTPSLSLILLLLLVCNCSNINKASYIYPFVGIIACIVRLLLYHHRNYSFENLRFALISNDYPGFDLKVSLRILSFVPIIVFFAVMWIKSALMQNKKFLKLCYVLPVIFSVVFAVTLPFARNFLSPVFVNTVFLLYFANRKDKTVIGIFTKMINYLIKNPVIAIPIVLSLVVPSLSDYDTFNYLSDMIDIIR